MPPPKQLTEKTWFIEDTDEEEVDKNATLAVHLGGVWEKLAIVKIDRIEIGSKAGWRATYRE